MEKYNINVKEINITRDQFTIQGNSNRVFVGSIIKGSVNFKVFNENNDEVCISSIDIGDFIKIYGYENNENIVIKKVLVKNKYIFNSDSSDDIDNLL